MSEAQLEAYRSLLSSESTPAHEEHILHNFRPVQPINGRPVYGADGSINSPLAQQLNDALQALDRMANDLSRTDEDNDEDNETIIEIQIATLVLAGLALIGVVIVAAKMMAGAGLSSSNDAPQPSSKPVSDNKPAKTPEESKKEKGDMP